MISSKEQFIMAFEDFLKHEHVIMSSEARVRASREEQDQTVDKRARELGREAAKYLTDKDVSKIVLFRETTEGELMIPERAWSSKWSRGIEPAHMVDRPAYERYAEGWSIYDDFYDGYDKVIRNPSIGLTDEGEVVALSVEPREWWRRGLQEPYQITAVEGQHITPRDRVICAHMHGHGAEGILKDRKFAQAIIRICQGHGPSRFQNGKLLPDDAYQRLFHQGEL